MKEWNPIKKEPLPVFPSEGTRFLLTLKDCAIPIIVSAEYQWNDYSEKYDVQYTTFGSLTSTDIDEIIDPETVLAWMELPNIYTE